MVHQTRALDLLLSSTVPYFLIVIVREAEKMRIEKIVGFDGLTLLIYYTKAHCWQFAVIGEDAKFWQSNKIFYTADAAEVAGKMFIGHNF